MELQNYRQSMRKALSAAPLDQIAFDIADASSGAYLATNIFINNLDLRSIIATMENQYHPTTHPPKPVGAYEGIPPFIAVHLNDGVVDFDLHDGCLLGADGLTGPRVAMLPILPADGRAPVLPPGLGCQSKIALRVADGRMTAASFSGSAL